MKKKFFVRILIMGLFLLFPIALTSCEFIPGEPSKVLPKEDFEISPYFCDGMVLQQKEMVTIKGKTEASVTMKVSLYRNEFEYKSITNIANDKGDFILRPVKMFTVWKLTMEFIRKFLKTFILVTFMLFVVKDT